MTTNAEKIIKVGVRYDDPKNQVFPFGVQWVEVGGHRIEEGNIQAATCTNKNGSFGEVTLVIAGYRCEIVNADEEITA